MRIPWWGIPTRNTLDRATAMLPRLLYERLDQIGIDVAIAYPTYGLTAIHLTDDELRPALSRAFNIVRRRGVRAVSRPDPAGCVHPDVHARKRASPSSSTRSGSSACARS